MFQYNIGMYSNGMYTVTDHMGYPTGTYFLRLRGVNLPHNTTQHIFVCVYIYITFLATCLMAIQFQNLIILKIY